MCVQFKVTVKEDKGRTSEIDREKERVKHKDLYGDHDEVIFSCLYSEQSLQ